MADMGPGRGDKGTRKAAPPAKNAKGAKGTNTKGGKKKAAAPDAARCFHCQSEGAKMCCSQCKRAWYCGKPCQKQHWKLHKRACVATVAAEARRATLRRKATAARGGGSVDKETCVICIGPVVAPVELPCGHAYCGGCLAELRAKKVAQACPLCRADLPPGVDGLYELAYRTGKRVYGMVDRGEVSWASLPPAEQEAIDEAEAMYTEAGAQGHAAASYDLGLLQWNVRQDADGAEAALRAAIVADPGLTNAHNSLGYLLKHERRDVDGAEAAYRAAIAAGPGYALAHCNLGILLEKERKDIDGAEAAYRAAIAADPGYAGAHSNLGNLLMTERNDADGAEAAYRAAIAFDFMFAQAHNNLGALFADRAERSEQSGGDLTAAAALWERAVEHFADAVALGVDDRGLGMARAEEARVQAALKRLFMGLPP